MRSLDDRRVREELVDRLKCSRKSLFRSVMSPALSYGRHRGPFPARSRHAAVLLAMYRDANDQWTIPLTRRPEGLKHHGGQICLPGGRIEPKESALQAALREFHEELGLQPQGVTHCGELPTVYVYNSDNRVHPVVVLIDRPGRPWCPDPGEVSQVIELPVSAFIDPAIGSYTTTRKFVRKAGRIVGDFEFRTPAFRHRDHHVWGATAVILDQFAAVLRRTGVS